METRDARDIAGIVKCALRLAEREMRPHDGADVFREVLPLVRQAIAKLDALGTLTPREGDIWLRRQLNGFEDRCA
jgi:hypothetical protein